MGCVTASLSHESKPTDNQNQPCDALGLDLYTNSTDYFKYIFDEEHYGTPEWKPFVKDFDYSLLAGAGVKECKDGKLKSENNMWTIAKNIERATEDIMPT